MKLSILVVLTALFLVVSGFLNPAVFYIGYLWATVLYPSAFASTVVPLSLTFGILCLFGYFAINKAQRTNFPPVFYLAIAFACWVTLTTFWAEKSVHPWEKWGWAIQSIIIVIAAPLFLKTRAQIETGLIAVLTAFSAHVMTAGIKTILGTGGYDRLGRLMMTNFWLGETSTLALAAVISIPMAYYAVNRSCIFENYRGKIFQIGFILYSIMAVMCVVGTSARTGVLALGALLLLGIRGLLRKAAVIALVAGVYIFGQSFLPTKSISRFGTINTYQQDSSAVARLAVWQWAISYAAEHPYGGGFNVFYTNDVSYELPDDKGQTIKSHRTIAPHSVYFEVLGEHGYPGLILYLALLVGGIWGTFRVSRMQSGGELQWIGPFSYSLLTCMLVFSVGASFVGIAFQPLLYIFLGFYCSVYRLAHNREPSQARSALRPQASGRPIDHAPA